MTLNSATREDIELAGGPRADLHSFIPIESREILDLGCRAGALAAAIKRRQPARVVGIEIEPDHAAAAATRLDRVIEGDLETVLRDRASELGQFDCVIAADVLEHLRDPWSALARATRMLKPGGVVVVSLPNIRHYTAIRALTLDGRWPRHDAGIFDATHLRWFTRRDALDLMRQAGLAVNSITPRLLERPGFRGSAKRALAKAGFGDFLAVQYVLTGSSPR